MECNNLGEKEKEKNKGGPLLCVKEAGWRTTGGDAAKWTRVEMKYIQLTF